MARLHKVTAEEVKALRATADMPMSECAKALREKAKDSYIEDLEKENAKLRKLVHKVEHYGTYGCEGCPHEDKCEVDVLYDENCLMSKEIEREKIELGIEAE